jgi:hypothetical protein
VLRPGRTTPVPAGWTHCSSRSKKESPTLDYDVTVPAPGSEEGWCQDAMETPREHALVTALAGAIAYATYRRCG